MPEILNPITDLILNLPRVATRHLPAEETSCSVCFQSFITGADHVSIGDPSEDAIRLACGHIFGRLCIARWVGDGNSTCPTCRSHVCGWTRSREIETSYEPRNINRRPSYLDDSVDHDQFTRLADHIRRQFSAIDAELARLFGVEDNANLEVNVAEIVNILNTEPVDLISRLHRQNASLMAIIEIRRRRIHQKLRLFREFFSLDVSSGRISTPRYCSMENIRAGLDRERLAIDQLGKWISLREEAQRELRAAESSRAADQSFETARQSSREAWA